jgi:polyisoprenoid-binding protein YceI
MTDTSTATRTWAIDPTHSVLEFAVTHMMFTTAKGRFLDFAGTIVFDERDVERSRVDVTIRTGSIHTGNPDRDTHLRSPDFFDVEAFPIATFHSTGVEVRGPSRFDVRGDLTIRGVTREVVMETVFNGTGTIPGGPKVAGFQAMATFSRKDFGLNWNVALEGGGVLVSDEVRLTLDIQASRADA